MVTLFMTKVTLECCGERMVFSTNDSSQLDGKTGEKKNVFLIIHNKHFQMDY